MLRGRRADSDTGLQRLCKALRPAVAAGALLFCGAPALARDMGAPFSTLPPPPSPASVLRVPPPACVPGDDVRVNQRPEEALAEVIIDVNPRNPSNIALCGYARDIKSMSTFHSFDGGVTWNYVLVGDAQDGLGATRDRYDPTLVFDAGGYLYVGYGVRVPEGNGFIDHLVVCRSGDGGVSFNPATTVWVAPSVLGNAGNDKFHLAEGPDRFDESRNVLMMAWTWNLRPELGSVDQQIVVSRSVDAGLTFSAPVVINDDSIRDRDFAIFADPAIGPNGVMYVAWQDLNTSDLRVDHSFDNGSTWAPDVIVQENALPFRTRIPPQPNRGVFAGPVMDVDRSGGPHHARAYLVYCHGSNEDTDVLVRWSDDFANTFSPPVRVNDDPPGSYQFLPWIDVNQTSGRVNVVFYDTRGDTLNHLARVNLAASVTGGENFYANAPVADVPSNNGVSSPTQNRYIGNYLEYIGVTGWGDDALVAWTDTRNTPSSITDYYFDRVPPDPTPPAAVITLDPDVLWPPNHKWVSVHATVTLSDEQDPNPTVVLHSIAHDGPGCHAGDGVKGAAFGTPDLDFLLRAERNGHGRGRVYTIVYKSTDASGNAGFDSAFALVPHDRGGGQAAPPAPAPEPAPRAFTTTIRSVGPNPANPAAAVRFELAAEGPVRLDVMDVRGRRVATLVDAVFPPGPHVVRWDGHDAGGNPAASGVYFILMKSGAFRETRKIVLVR